MKIKLLLLSMIIGVHAYAQDTDMAITEEVEAVTEEVVEAEEAAVEAVEEEVAVQSEKMELTKDQLPQTVQDAVAAGDYATWEVGNLFSTATEEGTLYEINVSSEGKNVALTYDAEGALLKAEEQE